MYITFYLLEYSLLRSFIITYSTYSSFNIIVIPPSVYGWFMTNMYIYIYIYIYISIGFQYIRLYIIFHSFRALKMLLIILIFQSSNFLFCVVIFFYFSYSWVFNNKYVVKFLVSISHQLQIFYHLFDAAIVWSDKIVIYCELNWCLYWEKINSVYIQIIQFNSIFI